MPSISSLLTQPRPEGGAVWFSFALPEGFDEVRVLRVEAGETLTGPDDPAAHVVFDGTPEPAEPYNRSALLETHPLPRYGVWDIQAFTDRFSDEENIIDTVAWTYLFYARAADGRYGEPVEVTFTPARHLDVFFMTDVKDLVYQRARYHALLTKAFVAKQEHVHLHKGPPQVIVKIRQNLEQIMLGAEMVGQADETTAVFHSVAEVLILCSEPMERDELGNYFTERFLGDLELLNELGWDGLSLSTRDGMMETQEELFYTREITLDGKIDAIISRGHTYTVADNQVVIHG